MIKIICVGKIKEDYLVSLINDYKTRITKYSKIEIIELKDTDINSESSDIINHINNKDYNILLDIKGDKIDSVELSKLISSSFVNGYSCITFIIGGSNGVDDRVKSIVNKRISFRGVLLEQIYRSFKIINNETYHK